MIEKIAYIPETDDFGYHRVIPFSGNGAGLEKAASVPDGVQRYIEKRFRPRDGKIGLLVTAMGASEYWGANRNGDWFDEKALCHVPPEWTDDPEVDRQLAKGWSYGYPTFYKAHAFVHHSNKDPNRSTGDIAYVTWDPLMKWVLAVVELDIDRANKHDGRWVLDRISQGRAIPWSMGCRVPYDLLSTSRDMDRYMRAWGDYDPTKHKSESEAILAEHSRKPIHGLSKTRKDYPDELLYHMNEVKSDGRKFYAINDFPSFFDLSSVGVPADEVAWSITKLGSDTTTKCKLAGHKCSSCAGKCHPLVTPGAVLWEDQMSKVASITNKVSAVGKAADINKSAPPQVEQATRISRKEEKDTDLPDKLLDKMVDEKGLNKTLSTSSLLGMILRPHEFRRVVMGHLGKRGLADKLDRMGVDLPPSFDRGPSLGFGPAGFDDMLSSMLSPFIGHRSCLGPVVHRTKVIIIRLKPHDDSKLDPKEKEIQEKVSAMYNTYRADLMQKIGHVREIVATRPHIRNILYGMDHLLKVGMVSGSIVPLITEETIRHLQWT